MTVFEKLVEAYAEEGLEVAAGLNPTLADEFFAAPFAWMVRDGVSVTDGVGISPQELYLLENLAQSRPSRKIFVIGNAFGWSTLALALANPASRVVAIDSGADENTVEGLAVTTRIAHRLGLDVTTSRATSPDDVSAVVADTLGSVDLAFVDGFHSREQIVKDYRALAPVMDDDGVLLFHDVVFCDLVPGFEQIVEESGWWGSVLPATTTGMAVLTAARSAAMTSLVRAWGGTEAAWAVVRAAAGKQVPKTGGEQRAEALAYIRGIEDGKR